MINKPLTQSWEAGPFFNLNLGKIYFMPTRINDSQAWILPANFFNQSNEWTIIFEFDEVHICLKMDLGNSICLYKKMRGSAIKQFEKEWLAFQTSSEETFDLKGFNFLN